MGARQPLSGNITESVSRVVAVGTNLCCKLVPLSSPTQPPAQPTPAERSHRGCARPARNIHSCGNPLLFWIRYGVIRSCSGRTRSVRRFVSETTCETTFCAQVQPARVVFRDSDGPKAFRIRRTGPAAPGKGRGTITDQSTTIPNPWFNSSSLKFGVCRFC